MNFERIKLIVGDNGSRFPYCTTLFIEDDVTVVVDPGAGERQMRALKQNSPVDVVINTHYHFDHIYLNYLFDEAEIWINTEEANCFRDKWEIARRLGMYEVYGPAWVEQWIERVADPRTPLSPYSPMNRHEWWLSTSRVDREYGPGEVLDFGRTRAEVIGAPGHTRGFCYLYFPEQGVVYAPDVDLTPFGPWYGGSDGSIDLFLASARRLIDLEARHFITGHEKGVLTREEFVPRLEKYLDVIDQRDERILQMIREPATVEQVTREGPIYGKKYLVDPWIYMWAYLMVEKHLERLVMTGRAMKAGDKYIAK
ncbi:MBL fold metallo-hydrolase [Desulfallas sp. Bu1-1]|uniref:MBL fold metallo-hydrolase n=1 Tax=Desulfallas sp. Bu1-1 TaxID=2787620 RepID=UPI0018A01C5C|nr:MBL fold metallo-hydrolase [Desulfallas sp. Bu1-1]MBF7082428.1 MBL fold metallo-hydrolase [Desulfallas sp. Bu1-1]